MKFDVAWLFLASTAILLVGFQANASPFVFSVEEKVPEDVILLVDFQANASPFMFSMEAKVTEDVHWRQRKLNGKEDKGSGKEGNGSGKEGKGKGNGKGKHNKKNKGKGSGKGKEGKGSGKGGKGKGSGKGKHTNGDDIEIEDAIRSTDDGFSDINIIDTADLEISNDDSELLVLCELFNDYRNLTDSDGVDDDNDDIIDPCDHPHSYLMCPDRYERGKICDGTSNETSTVDAIKEKYCVPLFDELNIQLLPGIMNSCVDSCVHYVSLDHGDCCDFVCPMYV